MKCHYEGTGCLEGRCMGTKEIDPCIGYERCATFKPYTMTNADRIRAMSDEELAVFLGECKFCDICEEGCDYCTYEGDCDERLLDWLKQPVKDGDNE